jgi:hypothetical protein
VNEDIVAEVSMTVKLPAGIKKTVEEMRYVEFKGDKIRLYETSDIAREALLKGLRLMILEREIFDSVLKKEAKEGAVRIYATLVNPAKKKKEVQVKR